MHIMQQLKVIGRRRKPIYTFQLTVYATEANEKKYFAVLCE